MVGGQFLYVLFPASKNTALQLPLLRSPAVSAKMLKKVFMEISIDPTK